MAASVNGYTGHQFSPAAAAAGSPATPPTMGSPQPQTRGQGQPPPPNGNASMYCRFCLFLYTDGILLTEDVYCKGANSPVSQSKMLLILDN